VNWALLFFSFLISLCFSHVHSVFDYWRSGRRNSPRRVVVAVGLLTFLSSGNVQPSLLWGGLALDLIWGIHYHVYGPQNLIGGLVMSVVVLVLPVVSHFMPIVSSLLCFVGGHGKLPLTVSSC